LTVQEPPQQNAGAFGAEPREAAHRVIATFRLPGRCRFTVVRATLCAGTGGRAWLRRRATAGVAAIILGLADGRSINSNAPPRRTGEPA
jgi:hypothetical protein